MPSLANIIQRQSLAPQVERGARTYNSSLGAEPPAGFRGTAPG